MTSALLAMDTGDLKSEGNRISCLPTDLLIVIFSTLRAMEVALKIHGRRWIVVSHVCRKWRDVALAFSNLWTHVSTSWGSIATEFIRRSGIAPLKLWILLTSSASHPEIEAVNLAIAHIFHACELHISVDDETDLLQDMWGKMRLIGCSQILTTISLRSTHKCEFPHPLFQNIPPGLRVLEMTMICLPSQPGLLRQLTRLKITSTNRCRISSGDMMDMLEFCVQLTDFDFRYFGRLGPPSSGTGIVTLPSLQRMSLALGNEVSMDFLYYLKLPADVSLVIKSRIRFPSPVLPAELYARV
ncbi:hypothetical protein BD410DRAFT_832338 [Rickenella mellea]|uniref:F-box domain-containing protein n=1 Tax=Rickenella mellea TaxID=50990 RepID=A0A4Y7PKM7_9AGAM|nr:hypothetical protein BD410DRAFT_832338 [Rickenella mellea]